MGQTTFSVRMDESLKNQFDNLCKEFGMNASTALDVYKRQNALCMMGPVLDPLLDQQSIPPTNQEYDLIKWPCRSQIPLEDALGLFRLGKVGLAFASGA